MTSKWSSEVTSKSDSLDLEEGVFTWDNPNDIAKSLKQSALKSNRKKANAYNSAMSMLNFYINRAGKKLKPNRRNILEKAKHELKLEFNRV